MRAISTSWLLGIAVGVSGAPSLHAFAGQAPVLADPEPLTASVAGEAPVPRSIFRHGGDGAVGDLGDAYRKPRGDAAHDLPLSVVEIPATPSPGFGPPGRVHHALSMRFGAAEKAMRSWGIDATDCRLQFRAPMKISQSGGSVSIDAMAQLRFGCRF